MSGAGAGKQKKRGGGRGTSACLKARQPELPGVGRQRRGGGRRQAAPGGTEMLRARHRHWPATEPRRRGRPAVAGQRRRTGAAGSRPQAAAGKLGAGWGAGQHLCDVLRTKECKPKVAITSVHKKLRLYQGNAQVFRERKRQPPTAVTLQFSGGSHCLNYTRHRGDTPRHGIHRIEAKDKNFGSENALTPRLGKRKARGFWRARS